MERTRHSQQQTRKTEDGTNGLRKGLVLLAPFRWLGWVGRSVPRQQSSKALDLGIPFGRVCAQTSGPRKQAVPGCGVVRSLSHAEVRVVDWLLLLGSSGGGSGGSGGWGLGGGVGGGSDRVPPPLPPPPPSVRPWIRQADPRRLGLGGFCAIPLSTHLRGPPGEAGCGRVGRPKPRPGKSLEADGLRFPGGNRGYRNEKGGVRTVRFPIDFAPVLGQRRAKLQGGSSPF